MLRLAPALAIGVLLAPVACGVLATLLPALGGSGADSTVTVSEFDPGFRVEDRDVGVGTHLDASLPRHVGNSSLQAAGRLDGDLRWQEETAPA